MSVASSRNRPPPAPQPNARFRNYIHIISRSSQPSSIRPNAVQRRSLAQQSSAQRSAVNARCPPPPLLAANRHRKATKNPERERKKNRNECHVRGRGKKSKRSHPEATNVLSDIDTPSNLCLTSHDTNVSGRRETPTRISMRISEYFNER